MADIEVFDIRPHFMFRFLFGYYHNVKNSRSSTRYALRAVSLAISILFIFVSMLCKLKSYFGMIWVFAPTFQYVINIICSIYTGDEYILEYCRFNPLIDDKRNKNVYATLNIILLGYLLMIMTSHMAFYGTYIYFLTLRHHIPCETPWQFLLVGAIRLATNMGRIPMFVIFGLLYCRVRIFCKKVREHILKNTGTFKCKTYMKIYEEIISTLQKTDLPMKFLLFTQLFLVFLDLSNSQYKMVTQFSIIFLVTSILHLISNMVVFFPSLIMEMISEETENMGVVVADKMISCINEDHRNECRHFLQYVRQRPITYVIWRAFKMDSRLLLSYLSLLVTYLVCVLQFEPRFDNNPVFVNSTAL